MKKPKKPQTTTVVEKTEYRIDRVMDEFTTEFKVYINDEWMADCDTLQEAQAWRDNYVYEQLKRAA